MYSKQLQDREAVEAFCSVIMLPHNFDWLNDELKRLITLFDMADMILSKEILVFGCFNENHKLMGIQHGVIMENSFVNHTFFTRHCKECVELTQMAIDELLKNYPHINKIVGTIPENNRAARIYATRCGFENKGISDDLRFTQNGIEKNVLIFEKEY